MMTQNLDATGHQWVGSLANYNFKIEYLKGCDNSTTDVLSRMTEQLGDDDVKCLTRWYFTIGAANQAELHNPQINIWINVVRPTITNTGPKGKINVVDWAQAQWEDPELEITIWWIKADWASSLRTDLGELADTKDGLALISWQKHLIIINNKLYMRATPPGNVTETKLFLVPRAYQRRAIDGCNQDGGHQGQNHKLSLAAERFWWPNMPSEVRNAVTNCQKCIKHEFNSSKELLHPIILTASLDLVTHRFHFHQSQCRWQSTYHSPL